MKKEKVILPEGYDSYDKALKKLFHEKADKLNFIGQPSGRPQLLCGAVRKGKRCHVAAGRGTNHAGYGRCKYHGGCNTGPKTEEGKARSSQNSRKNGFYSKAMTQQQYEIYQQVAAAGISLDAEISLWRVLILSYLQKSTLKWQRIYEENLQRGEDVACSSADKAIQRSDITITGPDGAPRGLVYHIGSADDVVLMKALDVLGRLIASQDKLRLPGTSSAGDIIQQVNIELQAASYGQVSISLTRE